MSLLQLPTETLISIFEYVGSSYFRSDLSRLTVCKQWNQFARAACFQDFYITQKTLQRLLSSPVVEPNLALVKDSAENFDLVRKGFDDWDSLPLSPPDSQVTDLSHVSFRNEAHAREVRAAWTIELINDLLCLATLSGQSPKLRTLRIQATKRREYLFSRTIRAFLSAGNLTSLELDICGTRIIPRQGEERGEGVHMCTSIDALLTTLRRLRLRLRSICAAVLKAPQGSTKLPLKEMLIKLSLSNESPLSTSAAHATCCGPSSRCFLQLKADMEKQAQILATQMAMPRMVRILTHVPPSIKMRAYDVLAGRNFTLGEDAKWDDDGEVSRTKNRTSSLI